MNIYLKLNTVTGESRAKEHVGWIELTSATFSSRGPNSRKLSELSCTKDADSTSATLMRLSVNGKPLSAIVDFLDDQEKIYLQLQLEEVLIASYSLSSARGESLTLNFGKVTISKFSADVPDDAGTVVQHVLSKTTP